LRFKVPVSVKRKIPPAVFQNSAITLMKEEKEIKKVKRGIDPILKITMQK